MPREHSWINEKENTGTSSNSAFRALNRSRWLVTMGNIEVSADEVNGIGVLRVVLPDDSPFLFLESSAFSLGRVEL